MLKKDEKKALGVFLLPMLFIYGLIYVYPTIRTFFMSFNEVPSLTSSILDWNFCGLKNFTRLFNSKMFIRSIINIGKIWTIGGILVLFMSLLLAVILTSGVKFKNTFKAIIYLPNVVSAVALGTMWLQYVYNVKYGLLHNIFSAIGAKQLAALQWTSQENLFSAMIIAYSFGMIGYFMLIYIAAIDDIPAEFYEAASLEGANKFQQFRYITLHAIVGVIKTIVTLWSVRVISFFLWSQIFSPVTMEVQTVTPMVYMYQIVFGSDVNATFSDPGLGASVGMIMTLLVVGVYFITNIIFKRIED